MAIFRLDSPSPLTAASNAGGVGRNRDSEPMALLRAVNAAIGQVLSIRHVFNCCWHESVKPLQFYCHTLPLSYQLHQRQLLFYRRLLLSDIIILRTGLPRVRFEMLGIAAKYVDDLHYSLKLSRMPCGLVL